VGAYGPLPPAPPLSSYGQQPPGQQQPMLGQYQPPPGNQNNGWYVPGQEPSLTPLQKIEIKLKILPQRSSDPEFPAVGRLYKLRESS
jgi:hypothetical protein